MAVSLARTAPIGFVGLGNLGRPMALNLVDRGWSLHVTDPKPSRSGPVLAAGAIAVGPAELAECRVICFAVPDDTAIRSVLADGLQERLTADHVLVVHSTTLPEQAKELAAAITAATGARYLEVPVSGGSDRARTGDLTALVGGDEDALQSAGDLLADEASQLFRLGDVGSASAAKLANQLIAFSALCGVHEALRLTQAYGIADDDVLAAIATATGDTWVGRNFAFWDRTALDYNRANVPVTDRPWSKDLREVLITAGDRGLDLPLARLLSELLPATVEEHARASEKAGA